MKAYKGFDKDLKCRGVQYEVGKTYEEQKAKLCECGFHACEVPLDVFRHYAPNEQNRFCEVELDGVTDERSNEDSKVCAKKITIGAEIGIPGLVKAHVEWVKEHLNNDSPKATNTGDCSAATNTGHCSAATNTGHYSAATNTGHYSAATNTGDCSAATNTGDCSAATNTGHCSAATNTGDCSAAEVSGKDSVAISTGFASKVKGAIGCAIVCVERGEWNGETYPMLAICSAIVDGETIKADTWYTVKDGKFVEVEE